MKDRGKSWMVQKGYEKAGGQQTPKWTSKDQSDGRTIGLSRFLQGENEAYQLLGSVG